MKNIFIISVLLCGSIIGQSVNKSFVATQRINGNAKKMGEYNFVQYSVKSNEGKELYQIVDKVDYDIPYSKLEVFSDGSSVLISSFYGTLTFISNNGTKAKTVKIKNDVEVEYERSIKSVTDEDNLVVLFSEANDNYSTIKKYNSIGNLVDDFTVDLTDVNGIAYSKKINQLYLSHIKWKNPSELERKVALLNNNGEVVKTFNTNFENGFFTDDNSFIGKFNKSVFSISTVKLKLDYKVQAEGNNIFIDVTGNGSSILVVQAKNPELKEGKWYYKNPIIIKLDSAGQIIDKIEIDTELFSEFKFQKTNSNLEFVVGEKIIIVE